MPSRRGETRLLSMLLVDDAGTRPDNEDDDDTEEEEVRNNLLLSFLGVALAMLPSAPVEAFLVEALFLLDRAIRRIDVE